MLVLFLLSVSLKIHGEKLYTEIKFNSNKEIVKKWGWESIAKTYYFVKAYEV